MKHFRSITNANALARRFGGGGGGGGGGGTAWTNGGVVTAFAGSTQSGNVDSTLAGSVDVGFISTPVPYLLVLQDGKIVYSASGKVYYMNGSTYAVTLLAGGASTFTDGTGAAAGFSSTITGIAQTSSGNIIVCDTGYASIRQITYPGGVVTTLAGLGPTKNVSSTGVNTETGDAIPTGALTLLPNGNYFCVDLPSTSEYNLARIYIYNPTTRTRTFLAYVNLYRMYAYGNYVDGIVLLNDGTVAVNCIAQGILYAVNYTTGAIRTILDYGTSGIPTSLSGVALLPSGNLVTCDGDNTGDIYEISISDGQIVNTLATEAYVYAFGVLSDGTIIANDAINLYYIATGGVVTLLVGNIGTGYAGLPMVVLSDNTIVLADSWQHRLVFVSYPGCIVTSYTYASLGVTIGDGIVGITALQTNSVVAVFNTGSYTITPSGIATRIPNAVSLWRPTNPVTLQDGNIAFADDTLIRVLTPSGSVYPLAGGYTRNTFAMVDGTGLESFFLYNSSMRLLPNGNLVVMDYSALRVVSYPAGVVTKVTGSPNGNTGYVDGPGIDARFSVVRGSEMCLLSDGTLVVPDPGNYRIRLVNSTTWYVSTLAGNDVAVSVDGTGSSAGFNSCYCCAVSSNGTILVIDNGVLRSITQAGVVTTISFPVYSSFSAPRGIAILSDGNIVVADVGNTRIRKITYPGAITTALAGSTSGNVDGTGGAAQFRSPYATAVLQNGDIAVVDQTNFTIRIVTYPGGVVSTLAGFGSTGYLDATGTAAKFGTLYGIGVLANGNIVVIDATNRRIRMITSGGVVTTLAGQTTGGAIVNGIGTTARFSTSLRGLTVLQDGKIAVADLGNNAIRLVNPFTPTPAYSAATATAGSTVTTLATLTAVYSLATLPDGNIAALTNSGAVYIVNYATGTPGTVTALSGATGFAASSYIAAIPSTTKLIVADSTNNQIKLIT